MTLTLGWRADTFLTHATQLRVAGHWERKHMDTPVSPRRNTERATAARKAKGNYKSREATGVITAEESFTTDAFISRLGITRTQFNEMRRRGLVCRKDGGRVKVTGADYIAYLQQLPEAKLNELNRTTA
jgi:hypothetical protein